MLIGIYESIGICSVCQDMDIFILLYTYDSKFLIIDEPTWHGYIIDDK